ncbi:Hypothetical protein R9X50_00568300 [Acrodontium crateriforme]|uniref:Uncharacterized protein n=1 Tax=Acrodontium crateriforme TaxID=150365 RepID=A0AAQ3M7N6_9PEZI|nr:Hypothetical protein R9X50_00568300 [Acrodontium crateriforme]
MAHFTERRMSHQPQLRTPENKKSVQRNGLKNSNATSSSPNANQCMEVDGDEDNGSAVEDQEASVDEPDASALSVVRKRLAGLQSGDDSEQATSGAEQEDSDDEYAGLDEISDDDDDDEKTEVEKEADVLRNAELDLIQEFERKEHRRTTDSALDHMFNAGANGGAEDDSNSVVDLNEDPFAGLEAHDSLYQDLWNDAEYDLGLWRLPIDQDHPESMGNKKRVRFEEARSRSLSVSSNSSVDANETFPDLFMAQDDPALAQHFAIDMDPDATFTGDYSDAESCYDFDGEEEIIAFEVDEDMSDSDEEDVSSEESDFDGDTTDEETEEETIARMLEMQRAAGKSPRIGPSTPAAAKRSSITRTTSTGSPTTPKNGRGPRTGTFILDPTRAAMSADSSSNKIKLLPPTKPTEQDKAFWRRARNAAASRNGSPTGSSSFLMRPRSATEMPDRPFTAQCTLASMFNGNIDLIRNNERPSVAPEMFPTALSRPQTSFGSTTWTEDSELEPLDVDMDDFIDMSSDSESDDEDPESATSPLKADDVFQTPRNDGISSGLLDHLEQQRGLVGSFRRNQSRVKHVSSLASHPIKRAATMESNALQTGRRGAANTPMTPARKNRPSQDMNVTGSGVKKIFSSPLAQRRPKSRGNSISGNGIYQTLSPSIMR